MSKKYYGKALTMVIVDDPHEPATQEQLDAVRCWYGTKPTRGIVDSPLEEAAALLDSLPKFKPTHYIPESIQIKPSGPPIYDSAKWTGRKHYFKWIAKWTREERCLILQSSQITGLLFHAFGISFGRSAIFNTTTLTLFWGRRSKVYTFKAGEKRTYVGIDPAGPNGDYSAAVMTTFKDGKIVVEAISAKDFYKGPDGS